MYVCIYVCMYVCKYVCTCVIYVCMHACMYDLYVCIIMYVCWHSMTLDLSAMTLHAYTDLRMYVCTYMCVHAYYMCVRMHVYMDVCKNACIYVLTNWCLYLCITSFVSCLLFLQNRLLARFLPGQSSQKKFSLLSKLWQHGLLKPWLSSVDFIVTCMLAPDY